MKKIIYSLVIMIAAGSLFTSCIEPIEPAGIYDLREAKARYYDALSKLRAADALYREAQADHEKAMAEYQRAKTENQNLLNYYQQLVNEAKELDNEKEVEKWILELEKLQAEREKLRITWETELAQALEAQRQALSQIEMAMLDLTTAEKTALTAAITRYNNALEAYHTAQEAVTAAEAALWDAEFAYNNMTDDKGLNFDTKYIDGATGDNVDGHYILTGEDLITYYESVVEYYEAEAAVVALVMAGISDPEVSDFAAWNDEIEELNMQIAELKYSRYEVTKDSALYMNNVFHDGSQAFTLKVDDWMEANGIRVNPLTDEAEYWVGPTAYDWLPMDKAVAPGEQGFDPYEYYGDEVLYVEGGELKGIPALEEDGSIAYLKFNYILNDYFTQISEAGDGTEPYMVLNGTDLEINANQMMKEFILGGETETPFKYKDANDVVSTAKYGLEGAVSVLKRELVLSDDPAETPDSLKTLAAEALKQWKDDRAILDAGLANFKDYKDAKTAYDTKKKAYDDAVKADEEGNTGLANATKNLLEVLNGVVGHADYSTPDTTTLVDAIVKFATARETYLPYTPYKNSNIDSTIFYYTFATSPVIIDSTYHFKDLTVKLLREKPYFAQRWGNFPIKPETSNPADYTGGGTGGDWLNGPEVTHVPLVYTYEGAFMNIFAQLLGPDVAEIIEDPALAPVTAAMLTNAFYNTYEYNATDNTIVEIATGDVYENPEVAKAAAALATAKENVKKAAKKFVEVYNRFWAADVNTTDLTIAPYAKFDDYFADPKDAKLTTALNEFKIGGTNLPLDHKCYKLETFTEPYNVVMFTGDDIMYTNALGAILVSVDPAAAGHRDDQDYFEAWTVDPVIFGSADGTKKTDFYKYMQAEYKYQMATALTEEVIKAIEAWIADVKAAFKANADYADAMYAAVKEVYDEYAKLFEELTGVPASGYAWYDAYFLFDEISEPVDYTAADVYQKEIGVNTYAGVWYLGGLQAEWAEEFIPGFPQKLAEWHTTSAKLEDRIEELENIKKAVEDAYVGALSVVANEVGVELDAADDTVEEIYAKLMADLEEAYVKALKNASEAEKALEKAKAGYDPKQIEIERLENLLELAQAKLVGAAAELAAAEEYYNNVLAHIFGEN